MFELIPWKRNRGYLTRPSRDLLSFFFEDSALPGLWTRERQWLPAFDVSETDEEIIVKAELPGMDVKDIDISLTDGLLTVRGERRLEKEDEGESYRRVERQFGSFSRSINLGVDVKADTIDASYKDGLLTVILPKAEETKAKRIEVKTL